MRVIGLADRLLADGHEVLVPSLHWPDEIQAKLPEKARIKATFDIRSVIEVVDSYRIKPETANAIEIGMKPWWFLRDELKAVKPRVRTKVHTIGISSGGHDDNPPRFDRYNHNGVDLTVLTPSFDDYPGFLDHCDIIVGAFGVSAWERAYFGIPSIAYLKAENQEENARVLCRHLMSLCFGVMEYDPNVLASSIELMIENPELVELMSKKCLEHVKEDSYRLFWAEVGKVMN